jgi:membrane peptidoglycan carboxypeptidase
VAKSNQSRLTAVEKPTRRRLIDYPRYGKRGIRRWIPSWRFFLGTFLTGVALVAGLIIAAYSSVKIPAPVDMALAQISTVYYADGEREMGQFAQVSRILIDNPEDLPDHVGQAVVAAEDRTFYTNRGVDFKGMARALYINVTQNKRQGGSTITQQYAENYYMDGATTYTEKFKEALLSIKLAQEVEKDEILLNYMNTIYFGRGASGIEVAAQRYFEKSAKDLTVEEAALIAGVIPSPSRWDPDASPEAREQAERRWNYVLDGMVDLGFLDATERNEMEFPETKEYDNKNQFKGTQGYLIEQVRKEVLEVTGMTQDELETSGVKIVSTFDYSTQRKLVNAILDMPNDGDKNLSVGGVTIDPKSGGVLAMYGGRDYVKTQFNAVTQGRAQAGSTFKPITLLAALQQGISVDRKYYNGNSPRTFDNNGDPYTVPNFANASYGHVNLVKATANSVNTAYVELNQEIGPQATANGRKYDVHTVKEITRADGRTIYEPSNLPQTVYDEEIGAELTYALSQVVEQGSGDKAKTIGHPIAGKTGTSNENRSAWFVGYTPSYATAITLYQSDDDGGQQTITPFGGYREITGSTVPLDIWVSYMGNVLAGQTPEEFPERTLKQTVPTPTSTATEEPDEDEEEAKRQEEEAREQREREREEAREQREREREEARERERQEQEERERQEQEERDKETSTPTPDPTPTETQQPTPDPEPTQTTPTETDPGGTDADDEP